MENLLETIYADGKFDRIRFYLQESGVETLEDLSAFNFDELMFVPGVRENDIKAAKDVLLNIKDGASISTEDCILLESDQMITPKNNDADEQCNKSEANFNENEEESNAISEGLFASTDTNGPSIPTALNGLLNREIDYLPLSVRAINCLKRAGIFTLGQLQTIGEKDFMSIRNMGVKTCHEILGFIETISSQSANLSKLHSPEAESDLSQLPEAVNPFRLRSEIDGLPLSVRAVNCLKNAGIHSLTDLLSLSQMDLMNIKNMGFKTCREIQSYIDSNSFSNINADKVYRLEHIDEDNKKIPILLLKSIGVSTSGTELLLNSGYS